MHRIVDWETTLRADAAANPGTTVAQAANRLHAPYRTVLDHCEDFHRRGILSLVRVGRVGHLFVPVGRFAQAAARLAFVHYLLPSNLALATALADAPGSNVELCRRLDWPLRRVQARTKVLHRAGIIEQNPGWVWTLRPDARVVLNDPALQQALNANASTHAPTPATLGTDSPSAIPESNPIEWFRIHVCRRAAHTHGLAGELECLLAYYGRHVMKRTEQLTLVDAYVHAFCQRLGHTHDHGSGLMECIVRTLWVPSSGAERTEG
jgi:hypothetical protein